MVVPYLLCRHPCTQNGFTVANVEVGPQAQQVLWVWCSKGSSKPFGSTLLDTLLISNGASGCLLVNSWIYAELIIHGNWCNLCLNCQLHDIQRISE